MSRLKARVELLDRNTSEPISEVDIITSSSEILYSNPNPTIVDSGNIKKGTIFNETPLTTILDNFLYPPVPPEINKISMSEKYNSDINLIENGTSTKEIPYTVYFYNGSLDTIKVLLEVHDILNGETTRESVTVNADKDSNLLSEFTLFKMTSDTEITVSLCDKDDNVLKVAKTIFKFVDPAYTGYVTPKIFDDNGDLNNDSVVNSSIVDAIKTLNTKKWIVSEGTDLYIDPRTELTYSTRELLNPFILIPKSWGDFGIFTDMNGNKMTDDYLVVSDLSLHAANNESTVSYTLFISKTSFYNNDPIVRGFSYRFSLSDIEKTLLSTGVNLRSNIIMSGLNVETKSPLDTRLVVEKYNDLEVIKFPYDGLLAYVKDIKTFFKYDNGEYTPTNNSIYLIESVSELITTLGGWDDIAINALTGDIYKKKHTNVWEKWGTLGGEGYSDGGTPVAQLRYRYAWTNVDKYVNNNAYIDVVTQGNTTYYCKVTNIGIDPSTDTSKIYWDIFAKGSDEEKSGGVQTTKPTGETSNSIVNFKIIKEV